MISVPVLSPTERSLCGKILSLLHTRRVLTLQFLSPMVSEFWGLCRIRRLFDMKKRHSIQFSERDETCVDARILFSDGSCSPEQCRSPRTERDLFLQGIPSPVRVLPSCTRHRCRTPCNCPLRTVLPCQVLNIFHVLTHVPISSQVSQVNNVSSNRLSTVLNGICPC